MREVVLIAHNLRSSHNVGSLLRTADGLGVKKVYLTGYTPYPLAKNDKRLPHIAQRVHNQIKKTALGAEQSVDWVVASDINDLILRLKRDGFLVIGLEQSPDAVNLNSFKPTDNVALIVGREVEGIEPQVLELTDVIVEIPMKGSKESFNVVQAAAMAVYRLTYMND